jgi:SAM-dependent methyltransferase
MPALSDAGQLLAELLCCPVCRARITVQRDRLTCASCGHSWARSDEGNLDLRLPSWDPAANDWRRRQDETCRYYGSLGRAPLEAQEAYRNDLGPFAPVLKTYAGRVLDIGGGNGIVRAFMDSPVQYVYVSVDPSDQWLSRDWDALADEFPCLTEPLAFVQAYAERLPFVDGVFDAALCLWTLNHCASPAMALAEMGRILRDSGRILLIVEDGEPTWSELAAGVATHYLIRSRAGLFRAKLAAPLVGWPTQSDHVAIGNRELTQWTGDTLCLRRRWWVGCYLALEYERRPRRQRRD